MPWDIARFRKLKGLLAQDPGNDLLLYRTVLEGQEVALDETAALVAARVFGTPVNPAIRLNDLHLHAHLKERQGRLAAGLSLTNARDPADVDFIFARDELAMLVQEATEFLRLYPRTSGASILLSDALASLGRLQAAEHALADLRNTSVDHVAAATCFDPAFRASLPEAAARAAENLPEVNVVRPLPSGADRAVFVSADYRYFETYGPSLLQSFVAHGPGPVVLQFHIMDSTEEETRAAVGSLAGVDGLRWALSTEWTGLRDAPKSLAAGYYHAVRFIRFWQFLCRYPGTAAWQIDIDMQFSRGSAALFECLEGQDLALFLAPARFEVRNKVTATCTGVAANEAARAYIRDVAGYVAAYRGKGRLHWGIDQVAMYVALAMPSVPRPRVTSLPLKIVGGNRGSGSLLWPSKDA